MQKSGPRFFVANAQRKGPLSRGKILIIISAFTVLIATVLLSLYFIEAALTVKYDQAVALMDSDVLKAKADFLKLGKYRDSSAKAQECQDIYDYGRANALFKSGDYTAAREIFAALGNYAESPEKVKECDYETAMALMNQGKLQEAMHAFWALGSFSDSEEQADICQKEMDYIAAMEMFDKQDYENALKAFKSLYSYKDSPDKAQECMDIMYGDDYEAAVKLLDKKDYTNALAAFKALGYYKDSADKAQECQNNLDYIIADKAYKDKLYYTAYLAFTRLGEFSDSAERAAKCVRKNPRSGEVYRNPKYKKNKSTVTFVAPKSGNPTCVKVYKGETLVSTLFVATGQKATISLPAGAYIIKKAKGTKWYGAIETFGAGVNFKTYTSKDIAPYTIYLLKL